MQLVGRWAPIVGAALVFVAAIVGKYYPLFSDLLLEFREQRDLVTRSGSHESIWKSVSLTWRRQHKSSAWSQEELSFLQGGT
ncbi:hypothetical protein V8E51_006783 [Hyaloscypha variabilis]